MVVNAELAGDEAHAGRHGSVRHHRWDSAGQFRFVHQRLDLLLGTPAVVSRVRRVEIDREYRKKKEGHTGYRQVEADGRF